MKRVKVFIAADHAGFAFKEKLKNFLFKKKISFEDLGPYSLNVVDDYPDYAFATAERVAKDKHARGILLCGSGSGMAIAANKVKGIRAVHASDAYTARMSRLDNDTNILSLRTRGFSIQQLERIVKVWLLTPFSAKKRHTRRLNKIRKYELGL